MPARHKLLRSCGFATTLLLALANPAAAGCTPDWIGAVASRWCFAFGGTLDADLRQPGAGDEINRFNRQADGPLLEHGRHRLEAGIHYDSFELDEPVAANLDVYRIELRYRWQLGRRLDLQVAPALTTSSNRIFADMTRDDLLLQVALTRHWRKTDAMAGIARDARLGGGLRVYPVFSMPVSLTANLHGAVGFPDTYMARPGRQWDWTVRLGPRGSAWHVLDDDNQFRFDFRLRRWELGVTTERRRQPRFFVETGVAFAREVHFTTSTAQRLEARLDNALFARVGLRLGSLDANTQTQHE